MNSEERPSTNPVRTDREAVYAKLRKIEDERAAAAKAERRAKETAAEAAKQAELEAQREREESNRLNRGMRPAVIEALNEELAKLFKELSTIELKGGTIGQFIDVYSHEVKGAEPPSIPWIRRTLPGWFPPAPAPTEEVACWNAGWIVNPDPYFFLKLFVDVLDGRVYYYNSTIEPARALNRQYLLSLEYNDLVDLINEVQRTRRREAWLHKDFPDSNNEQ